MPNSLIAVIHTLNSSLRLLGNGKAFILSCFTCCVLARQVSRLHAFQLFRTSGSLSKQFCSDLSALHAVKSPLSEVAGIAFRRCYCTRLGEGNLLQDRWEFSGRAEQPPTCWGKRHSRRRRAEGCSFERPLPLLGCRRPACRSHRSGVHLLLPELRQQLAEPCFCWHCPALPLVEQCACAMCWHLLTASSAMASFSSAAPLCVRHADRFALLCRTAGEHGAAHTRGPALLAAAHGSARCCAAVCGGGAAARGGGSPKPDFHSHRRR